VPSDIFLVSLRNRIAAHPAGYSHIPHEHCSHGNKIARDFAAK